MNTNLNDLLAKELSRRDFLKMIGGAFIMLIGIHNFIAYFSRYNQHSNHLSSTPTSHGFGSSKFGR